MIKFKHKIIATLLTVLMASTFVVNASAQSFDFSTLCKGNSDSSNLCNVTSNLGNWRYFTGNDVNSLLGDLGCFGATAPNNTCPNDQECDDTQTCDSQPAENNVKEAETALPEATPKTTLPEVVSETQSEVPQTVTNNQPEENTCPSPEVDSANEIKETVNNCVSLPKLGQNVDVKSLFNSLNNILAKCNIDLSKICGNAIQSPSSTPEVTKPAIPADNSENVEVPSTDNNESVPENNENEVTESKDNVSFEEEVVNLVNKERAIHGLAPLKLNEELSNVARAKSQDMHDNKYFSHTSPTYGSPFDMIRSFGINYRTAGENIAMGYGTPEAVMTGWMNSPGHRANILNSSFTEIGVGYVADGNYWTQQFIG